MLFLTSKRKLNFNIVTTRSMVDKKKKKKEKQIRITLCVNYLENMVLRITISMQNPQSLNNRSVRY